MAALPELAREAGLDPLRCPHCGRRTHTIDAVDLLFETILHRIRRGETVHIRGFGSFRTAHRVGRGLAKDVGSYVAIRFVAAAKAKDYVRGGGR